MNTKEIVLQYGNRGMDCIKNYIADDVYTKCAHRLVSGNKKVAVITTGFFVKNSAETDGPPGAYFLYRALKKLGYRVNILVDPIVFPIMCKCVGYDELINMPLGDGVDSKQVAESIRDTLDPSIIISIERSGRAVDGKYKNMSGVDIGPHTAKIDEVFQLLSSESYTIAIGDGGNEIGMGNLSKEINQHLDIDPCLVTADELLIATVSNWGAYGLITELEKLSGQKKLLPTVLEQKEFIEMIVSMGAVNGMSGKPECIVDGFDANIEQQILSDLLQ